MSNRTISKVGRVFGARFARLSAALALIAGLLGMHGLVLIDTEHLSGSAPLAPSAATMHLPADASVPALHDTTLPAVDSPGVSHGERPTATQDGTPHHGEHQMVHLCLAVLAALLLLVSFVGPVWILGRWDLAARLLVNNGRRAPPQRPPPMSVRLAQLCVMRN